MPKTSDEIDNLIKRRNQLIYTEQTVNNADNIIELSSLLNALVVLLIQKGIINSDELEEQIQIYRSNHYDDIERNNKYHRIVEDEIKNTDIMIRVFNDTATNDEKMSIILKSLFDISFKDD